MFTRSLALAFVVGALGVAGGAAHSAAAPAPSTSSGGGGFSCKNELVSILECDGTIANFPIKVTVTNVKVLDNNQLNVVSNDLDNLAVKDNNIADKNVIANDVKAVVLNACNNKLGLGILASLITVIL